MQTLTLSPAEIEEITGYRRYTEQQRQLRCHGIPFTTDGRNRPIVLRRHLEPSITELPKVDEYVATEPNFDAIYGTTTKKIQRTRSCRPGLPKINIAMCGNPRGQK